MDEEAILAAGYYHARPALMAKWNQLAHKQTITTWRSQRPETFDRICDFAHVEEAPLLAIDIKNTSQELGQYGYPTNYILDYRIDSEFVNAESDHTVFDEYHGLGASYIENLFGVLRDAVPQSLTMSEYFVYVAYQNYDETKVADAFGIAKGTVRSKVGRVRAKLESARKLQTAIEELEHFEELGSNPEFYLPASASPEISESEFPVNVVTSKDSTFFEFESFAPDN